MSCRQLGLSSRAKEVDFGERLSLGIVFCEESGWFYAFFQSFVLGFGISELGFAGVVIIMNT